MFEQTFKNIDDILHKDAGCGSELDYVEQTSYIESGVDELDQEKLPKLLELKYQDIADAAEKLGCVERIRVTFVEFQKFLYMEVAA